MLKDKAFVIESRVRKEPWFMLPICIVAFSSIFGAAYALEVISTMVWLLGAIVVLFFMVRAYTQARVNLIDTPKDDKIPRDKIIQYTTLIFGLFSTALLGGLGLFGKSLPLDLESAGIVIVLFSLACIGLVFWILRLHLLSIPILFLGITFLYTSSAFILYQYDGNIVFERWYVFHLESTLRGMPLVMLAFSSFLVGALLATIKRPARFIQKNGRITDTSGLLWSTALILYVAVMVVIAIYTVRGNGLSLVYQDAYRGVGAARRSGELAGLIAHTLTRFLPWSLLMLTAASTNRRRYTYTLGLAIPALVIMVMMGDRSALLNVILLMASATYLLGYTIDWKRSAILIVFVAFLVPTILNLRNIPLKEWSLDSLTKAATNQVEGPYEYGKGPPLATLASMSRNYQTLMGTVMMVPSSESYQYGIDYLMPFVKVIPYSKPLFSALGIEPKEKVSHWFKNNYIPDILNNPGYLQVAEAYLQFGAFGIIFLYLLLGVTLVRLWWYLQTMTLDSQKLAYILIMTLELFIWIRADVTGFIRTIVWGWCFVYAIPTGYKTLKSIRSG